ncbi:MAG: MFS transporter [Terrisporobacter sp.]
MENKSKLKKNMPLLIILAISGAFIYSLPYMRSYYYDAFMEVFAMTNTEMGLCGTYYGLFGAVSYLIGGVIADKISIKKLIPFSMIVTGIAGFYLLTSPSPMQIALIHGLWGVTSLMTFWPALLKALRSLANSNEQAKAFGMFEGGRGVTNAAYLAVAVVIFSTLTAKGGNVLGVKGILAFYSVGTVLLGVLSIFLLKNINENKDGDSSNSFSLKMVGQVIKMPALWMMIAIIFCTYSMNMSYYYISPYVTAAFGTSAVFSAMLTSMSQYIRPVSAIGAGVIGDKINSSKVLLISQFVTLGGLLIIMFTPVNSSIMFILIGCVLVFATMYVSQSMHFAIMEESNFPAASSGTAIGIICCIGYLPEAVCPYVAGVVLDKYTGLAGYNILFMLLAGVTVVGIGLTFVWLKMTKVKRAEILSLSKKNKESKAV